MPADTQAAPTVTAIPDAGPLPASGSPVPAPGQSSADSDFSGYFADTDHPHTPDPKPETKEPADQDPLDKKPIGKTDDKPAEKPADQVKPADQAKPGDKPAKPTAWQLVHQKDKEISELRKQIQERDSKPAGEHPELKTFQEKLDAAQKRIEEYETRLKFTDYSQSEEYKNQYEKPYVNAFIAGRNRVSQLAVYDDNGEPARRGKPEDFDELMTIVDDGAAANKAQELFGAQAATALYHRERVTELLNAKNTALEDYRSKAGEMAKTSKTQFETQSKVITGQINDYWKKHVEGPREKFAELGKPVEGDAKGNELLTKGYEKAQKAFANLNPFDPKLTPEQREEIVKAHGMVINKAAWFDRLYHWRKQDQATIKELQGKLKEFEDSNPDKGGTNRRGLEPKVKTWEDQLSALAR